MTTYDRAEVPILNFHNPAGAIYYSDGFGLLTYPMGNTRKRSITEQIGTTQQQHLDLLLLGCGDVRNVLCTVSELSQRKPHHRPKSIEFHLNDYDAMILPRNAIILDIASHINPDSPDDVNFLWNVWYNMSLSESHRNRLQQVITSLLDRNFDANNDGCVSFQNSRTEQECRAVWKDWQDLHLDVRKVKDERTKYNTDQFTSAEDICQHLLNKLALAICSLDEDFLRRSSSLHEEVRHWSIEGSTTDDNDCINPTFIHPFVHKWKINYNGSPFEGYMPFTKADIQRCKSLTAVCKETLTLWVKHFQQFKQLRPIKVNLWNGDGLWLCTSELPSDLLFDVIDTSNVSDHIGLLNVLVCCSPRLKRPGESQLQTSSMLCWAGKCEDMEDYYNKCIGINTNLLPTILGLHLAVDLDMGNRRIPDDWEETLYWVKASTDRTRLTIDKESDVITALWNLTKRCFQLIEDLNENRRCGVTLSSPFTLLRIIHQMHPLIEGGVTRIMDLLENELPYDFYQEHGFSWKLLKSAATKDGEPILRIQVQLRLYITEEGKHLCPIPMIVFLKNPFLDLFSGFQDCPVLYNSLRFNVQEGHVTFHMLEKDWEIAKSRFLLHVVDNQKLPVFLSKPVPLEHDSLFDVQRVDPVETFGLFAVQEFNICDSSSPILKLLKVQEEDDSYKAEFAILDPVKCNAKDMTTQFTPESSPTEIKLNFQRETGSTMRFSCPTKDSSKFKISKKQGSVVCQIRKKDNFVSGEMALINPAQVPFHAMSSWDPKHDDIEWTCSKMHRDNMPKLLAQKEMGHPFFELRCLIRDILEKQINEQDPAIYEISLDKSEGNLNKGLIIKVLSPVYKWNNLPYAKCTFYDKQHAGDDLKDPTKVMQTFFLEFLGCSLNYVITKQEPEIEMILRMMYINAARTDQKNAITSDWKDSFICPLYARETFFNRPPETVLDAIMRDSFFRNLTGTGTIDEQREDKAPNTDQHDCCAFCHTPSENLKKCTRCKKVSYCNHDCQKKHWKKGHKDDCLVDSSFEELFPNQQGQFPGRTTVPNSLNTVTNEPFSSQQKEPEDRNKGGLKYVPSTETYGLDQCAFCRKPSENLKKCIRCKKVSYCNQECQVQHWKKGHKDNCLVDLSSEEFLSQQGQFPGRTTAPKSLNTETNEPFPSQQKHPEDRNKGLNCVPNRKTNGLDRCAFCQKPSENLKKCTRCGKVVYCNQDCQEKHWKNEHKRDCSTSSLPHLPGKQEGTFGIDINEKAMTCPERKPSNLVDRCAFCRKPSENLKKCTMCKKVSYCNQDCQAQHWKNGHKNICRASSSEQLPCQQKEPEGLKEVLKSLNKDPNQLDRCAFCRKPSEHLKKCTRCKKVSYCSKDCQAQHWKMGHKSNCPSSASEQVSSENKDSFGAARSDALDRCAFCHKASEDLKKVFYCNRDCQEKHWKKELNSVCACGHFQ